MPRRDDSGSALWWWWRRCQNRGIDNVNCLDGIHGSTGSSGVNRRSYCTSLRCHRTVCAVAAKCCTDPASGKRTTARNGGMNPVRINYALQRSIKSIDRSKNLAYGIAMVVTEIHPYLD